MQFDFGHNRFKKLNFEETRFVLTISKWIRSSFKIFECCFPVVPRNEFLSSGCFIFGKCSKFQKVELLYRVLVGMCCKNIELPENKELHLATYISLFQFLLLLVQKEIEDELRCESGSKPVLHQYTIYRTHGETAMIEDQTKIHSFIEKESLKKKSKFVTGKSNISKKKKLNNKFDIPIKIDNDEIVGEKNEEKEKGKLFFYRKFVVDSFQRIKGSRKDKIIKLGVFDESKIGNYSYTSKNLSFFFDIVKTLSDELMKTLSIECYTLLTGEINISSPNSKVRETSVAFFKKAKINEKKYLRNFDQNRFKKRDIILCMLTESHEFYLYSEAKEYITSERASKVFENRNLRSDMLEKYFRAFTKGDRVNSIETIAKRHNVEDVLDYMSDFAIVTEYEMINQKFQILQKIPKREFFLANPFDITETPIISFSKKRTTTELRKMGFKNLVKHADECGFCMNNKYTSKGIKLLRCSRCKVEMYCSRKCQKKDWKNHEEKCDMYKRTIRVNSGKKSRRLKVDVCGCCGIKKVTKELKRCGGCNIIFYCDRKCQKKAWKGHKKICNKKKDKK